MMRKKALCFMVAMLLFSTFNLRCTVSWNYINTESIKTEKFEKNRNYCLIDELSIELPVLQVLPVDENAKTYLQKKAPSERISALYSYKTDGRSQWTLAVPAVLGSDFDQRITDLFTRYGHTLRRHLQVFPSTGWQRPADELLKEELIFQKELALVTPSPFRPYGMMNGIMESASLDRCRLVPSAFRYLMTPPGPTFFGEGCADSIDELTLLGQRAYIRSRFFEESSRIPSPQVWDSASLEECDTRIVLMGARPYSSRSGLEAANVVLTVLSLGLIPAYSDSPEYRLDFSQSQALAARGKAEIVVVHGERSIVSVLFVPLLGSLNQAHSIAEQAEQQHRMGDALLKELERRL